MQFGTAVDVALFPGASDVEDLMEDDASLQEPTAKLALAFEEPIKGSPSNGMHMNRSRPRPACTKRLRDGTPAGVINIDLI